jgi:hypothetical protein
MDEQSNDELESVIEPTEEVVNTEEVEVETPVVETEDTSDIEEKNRKLFERAKKAEAELKALRAKATPPAAPAPSEKQDGLTPLDTLSLFNAKVTVREDIETTQKWAKLNNQTIDEALADETLKAVLKARAETRATAEATNTGTARRGSQKPSDEQLLASARTGKAVDDIDALADAHFKSKFN